MQEYAYIGERERERERERKKKHINTRKDVYMRYRV
jgi:hypothetical protein